MKIILNMLPSMRKEFIRIIILLMVCGVLTVYKQKIFIFCKQMRMNPCLIFKQGFYEGNRIDVFALSCWFYLTSCREGQKNGLMYDCIAD